MSLSIDSLSGLADTAKKLEAVLGGFSMATSGNSYRMSRALFQKLQHQINSLQVVAPNHDGVLKARVQWYELALNSFEEYVVKPAELGEWPYIWDGIHSLNDCESPDLLAGTDTIDHFLRRHYLKGSFGQFFTRVLIAWFW
jgi:hypothetical protein